ncbi:MAG: PKD domain-containing protein [Crocinitomicaceae bacterium]|nr:PKD domain-containing protein [Crocinitomicaceae bacterium]
MKRILFTLLVIPFIGAMQANAQGCQADFVQDSTACPNVAFTDISTSNTTIIQWYWDFGDGNTSTAQNGSNTYAMDGTYTVCLTTISSDSCGSTICQIVDINCIGGGGGGGSVCQANFALDSSICPNVSFVDLSASQFPIIQWYWDFGDGNTSTSQYPSHTYGANGNYNVCLTTTSSDTCMSSFCSTVNISCLGGGGGAPCQASFTSVSFPDSLGGTIMYITNTSTVSPGTGYFWDFGDGNTSTDQYPTHAYTSDGAYMLCLTISDSSCTSMFCDSILVTGSQNGFTLMAKPAAAASVESLELISGLQLYPNPTNHNLTLNLESAEVTEIEVSILNVAGQVVGYSTHQIGTGRNEVKLYTEGLMKGYYFVKINSSVSNIGAIRFIKN